MTNSTFLVGLILLVITCASAFAQPQLQHLCQAKTSKETPCQQRVARPGDYCHQHRITQEALLVHTINDLGTHALLVDENYEDDEVQFWVPLNFLPPSVKAGDKVIIRRKP